MPTMKLPKHYEKQCENKQQINIAKSVICLNMKYLRFNAKKNAKKSEKSCSKICTYQILFVPLQRDTKITTLTTDRRAEK